MDAQFEDAARDRMDAEWDRIMRSCPSIRPERLTVAEDGVMFGAVVWRRSLPTEHPAHARKRTREDCEHLIAELIAEAIG